MSSTRRAFLGSGLGVFGALALGSQARGQRRAPERKLVLLELFGGNDGLNTVVPFAEKAYRAERGRIALPEASLLPIADGRALHPRLVGLQQLFQAGVFQIVEGTGYAEPNRSHFSSQDIWYTARHAGRASGDGWIGRLLAELYPADRERPHGIHVGAGLPYSLASSTHPVVYLEIPAAFRFAENARAIAAAVEKGRAMDSNAAEAAIGAVARGAQQASAAVRDAVARYQPRAEYPRVALGTDLKHAAAILAADIGARVVSVRHEGYDFHDDQLRRQDVLLHELDACLATFWKDFLATPAGEHVLVLVFSEFGRRVADNASGGTDHGTAGPLFLMGRSLRRGLAGRHPALEDLDAGDLRFTTDFRSVYASVLEDWFGVEPERVLGARFPKLPLFV